MIIHSIKYSEPLRLEKIKTRWFKQLNPSVIITIETDQGTYVIETEYGFEFDQRSGGPFVDLIAPYRKNQKQDILYAIHDVLYYGFAPRIEADEILLWGLPYSGLNQARAYAVYRGVRLFGGFAYTTPGDNPYKGKYAVNKGKIEFQILDKFNTNGYLTI